MNKKKIVKIIIASSAIAGGISLSSTLAYAAEGKGKVINVRSGLNVRAEAGIQYEVVTSLQNGQEVEICGEVGSWYKVNANGKVGYVSKDYIEKSTSNNTSNVGAGVSSGTGHVVNISSSLNIRQSASTSSTIVGSLRNGESFNILGKDGGWYHIQAGGVTGYVSAQYVQEGAGNAAPQAPQAPAPAPITGTGHVVNISSSLNIRQSASTSSAIVGSLRNGESFNILGKDGGWYHIQAGGVTGYVSAQYVQEGAGNAAPQAPQAPAPAPTTGTGHVVNISSSLNIRQSASTSSAIVGSLRNGESFNILGKDGGWYHIQAGGVTGYVSAQYVQEGASSNAPSNNGGGAATSSRGKVINVTSNLRMRSAASTSSSVIGYLRNGQVVDIIERLPGWVHIRFDGKVGYVCSDYITEDLGGQSTASFEQVFGFMRQNLGSPYVWGGSGEMLTTESLNALKRTFPIQAAAGLYNRAAQYVNKGHRAFDCSGLMQWGYKQAGISIGRSTWDQINDGSEVSLSNLQPGDLLFYSNLQHVGMYIGNGQWIESPNSSADIRIVSVPWSKIGRARRILQ